MSVMIGPLPVVEIGKMIAICVLPGEVPTLIPRIARVSRDRNLLQLRFGNTTLIIPNTSERALRSASRISIIEGEGDAARVLKDVSLAWDV